jgi:hypothetical protein
MVDDDHVRSCAYQLMMYMIAIALLVGFLFGLRLHVVVFAIAALAVCVLSFAAIVSSSGSMVDGIVAAFGVGIAMQVGYVVALLIRARR